MIDGKCKLEHFHAQITEDMQNSFLRSLGIFFKNAFGPRIPRRMYTLADKSISVRLIRSETFWCKIGLISLFLSISSSV